MTTKQEIQQALLDCTRNSGSSTFLVTNDNYLDQMGRNGFEKAHVWKSEIGK